MVLLENGTIAIKVGPIHTGVTPTMPAGSGLAYICYVRRVSIEREMETVDVGGACGVQNRYTDPKGKVVLEGVKLPNGASLFDPTGDDIDPLNRWVEVVIDINSVVSAPRTYLGVCNVWTESGEEKQAWTERAEIDLNALAVAP